MSSLLNKLNTKKLPAILQCPLCDYHIKRNTMFEAHVLQEHGISAKELYIQQHSQGVNKCKCGCGGEPKWIGYNVGFAKFIVGHNANIYSSYDEETAKKIALTRGSNWRGKSIWKGRTKENDANVAERGKRTSIAQKKLFAEGKIVTWNKGLTKETDPRLAKYSESLKQQFTSREKVVWHKGLTAETDERVKKKNDDLKQKYATKKLIQWHKGLTKHDDPRIGKFHQNRDYYTSY